MATVSDLIEQGVLRMRLPHWNATAYLEPRDIGPWADLYDVGTQTPVLIGQCDLDDRWIPADVDVDE